MENEYLFSELDQYLFGHATHYDLYKKLGAHPTTIDGVEVPDDADVWQFALAPKQ